MSYEDHLIPILRSLCAEVHPVSAPFGTKTPYVIWQRAGGKALRNINKSPTGGLRNANVIINVWADTPKQATDLLRQIEDAFAASTAVQALPATEPLDVYDDGGATARIFGFQQTFSVWGKR